MYWSDERDYLLLEIAVIHEPAGYQAPCTHSLRTLKEHSSWICSLKCTQMLPWIHAKLQVPVSFFQNHTAPFEMHASFETISVLRIGLLSQRTKLNFLTMCTCTKTSKSMCGLGCALICVYSLKLVQVNAHTQVSKCRVGGLYWQDVVLGWSLNIFFIISRLLEFKLFS